MYCIQTKRDDNNRKKNSASLASHVTIKCLKQMLPIDRQKQNTKNEMKSENDESKVLLDAYVME